MAEPLIVSKGTITSADGDNSFTLDAATTINGDLTVRGDVVLPIAGDVIRTDHDALYAHAADMKSNGTEVPESAQDVGLPRWSLADAATQRVKWTWAIPVGWDTVKLAWGWDNESAASGNVKWQFDYRLVYVFTEGDVDAGAVTTIAIPAITADTQFDSVYSTPSETATISTPNGGLGDKPFMQCSLSRVGADAADTLAGAVAVFVTSITRV